MSRFTNPIFNDIMGTPATQARRMTQELVRSSTSGRVASALDSAVWFAVGAALGAILVQLQSRTTHSRRY